MSQQAPFWEAKKLSELSAQEWESLCDHCGKCCVEKLIDDDTEELVYTNHACQLYNCEAGGCRSYANRHEKVPDCMPITVAMLENDTQRRWLPDTCAYRVLAEGYQLADWHPLISGRAESVYEAGETVYSSDLYQD